MDRIGDLKGIIPATVLPLTAEAQIDEPALRKYIRWIAGQGIRAVAVNVTVTEPTNFGFVRMYPEGFPPVTSTINFRPAQTRSNNAVLPLSRDGDVRLLSTLSSGSVHLVLDAFGYFE